MKKFRVTVGEIEHESDLGDAIDAVGDVARAHGGDFTQVIETDFEGGESATLEVEIPAGMKAAFRAALKEAEGVCL